MVDGLRAPGQLQQLRPAAPSGPIGAAVRNVAVVQQQAQLQQQQQQQQQVLQQQAEEKRRQAEVQQNLRAALSIARADGKAGEKAFKALGLDKEFGTGEVNFVGDGKTGRIFMDPGVPGQKGTTFFEVTAEGAREIPNISGEPEPVKENVRIKSQKRLEEKARPFKGETKDQELDRIEDLINDAKAARLKGVPILVPLDSIRDLKEFDPQVFREKLFPGVSDINEARKARADDLLREAKAINAEGGTQPTPAVPLPAPTQPQVAKDTIRESDVAEVARGLGISEEQARLLFNVIQ